MPVALVVYAAMSQRRRTDEASRRRSRSFVDVVAFGNGGATAGARRDERATAAPVTLAQKTRRRR